MHFCVEPTRKVPVEVHGRQIWLQAIGFGIQDSRLGVGARPDVSHVQKTAWTPFIHTAPIESVVSSLQQRVLELNRQPREWLGTQKERLPVSCSSGHAY